MLRSLCEANCIAVSLKMVREEDTQNGSDSPSTGISEAVRFS